MNLIQKVLFFGGRAGFTKSIEFYLHREQKFHSRDHPTLST